MTYDRDRLRPVPPPGLRLLPWETPEGKPCYLRTSDHSGLMSRIADNAEEKQVRAGADALSHAVSVLANPTAGPLVLRTALQWAATALGEVLRVADSRGARLSENEGDGPKPLPPEGV